MLSEGRLSLPSPTEHIAFRQNVSRLVAGGFSSLWIGVSV